MLDALTPTAKLQFSDAEEAPNAIFCCEGGRSVSRQLRGLVERAERFVVSRYASLPILDVT